jgi:exonuclease VII small subunit
LAGKKSAKDKSFEEAINQLERVVIELEEGELSH